MLQKGKESTLKTVFLALCLTSKAFCLIPTIFIVVSNILNRHQKFLQPELSKASPSIQRLSGEIAVTCSWPKSLQRMISGNRKLLNFAHESITKQYQEAETRQIQTSSCGFSRVRIIIH